MSIFEASQLISQKDLKPTELVEAHLSRIEKINSKLNAFITVMKKDALEQAHSVELEIQKGNSKGPLQGIPIGLKDLFNTKGVRTAAGAQRW